MVIIMLSSFKLVFDTYIDKLSPDDPLVILSLYKFSPLDHHFIPFRLDLPADLHNRDAAEDNGFRFLYGRELLLDRVLESDGLLHRHHWFD